MGGLPYTVILDSHHSGEIVLAATERLAARYRLEGYTTIGPKGIEALALVNRVLGGRVIEVRNLTEVKRERNIAA